MNIFFPSSCTRVDDRSQTLKTLLVLLDTDQSTSPCTTLVEPSAWRAGIDAGSWDELIASGPSPELTI
jgi:hypothetical protein